MSYSNKIRDYAKQLYLEVNEQGGQRYSYRDIHRLVIEKTSKKSSGKKGARKSKVPSGNLIRDWAQEGHWDIDLQDNLNEFKRLAQAERERREAQARKEREEMLGTAAMSFENLLEDIRTDYEYARQIFTLKSQFTMMYLNRRYEARGRNGELLKFTKREVQERMLTPYQETQILNHLSRMKIELEKEVLEQNRFVDRTITVNMNIISTED